MCVAAERARICDLQPTPQYYRGHPPPPRMPGSGPLKNPSVRDLRRQRSVLASHLPDLSLWRMLLIKSFSSASSLTVASMPISRTCRSLIPLLAVVGLFSANLFGQEVRSTSPAVKRIIDDAARTVKRNRTEFDKANQKPLDDARKQLEELSTKLIKDGKTDEAAIALRQIKTLEADVMRVANAPPVAAGAVAQKPLLERLAGKWDRPDTDESFLIESASSIWSISKSKGIRTQMKLISVDQQKCDLQYHSGWRLSLRPAGEDAVAVFEWSPKGERKKGFALERMK